MDFTYVAVDTSGERQKGKIDANSQKEVLDYLRANNQTPISVKQIDAAKSSFGFLNKVKNSDIVIFTRQLSSMILTGLTLIESLNILKQQINKPRMQEIINDLIAQISEGTTFSQALATHSDVFSEIYIALIKAAEAGGLLDKVLSRLADNMEKSEDLRKRVKSALFYPLIVITGVVIVIAIMNIFVIPQLGQLYNNLNLPLPVTTRIVLGMSSFFTNFSPLIVIAIIVLAVLYRRFSKTDLGRKVIDKAMLKLPVLGTIFKLSILDEITRTVAILISSGTSILESLTIAANVSNNIWYRNAMRNTANLVEKGIPLSSALQNQNIFPTILIQMIKVGESTGRIDDSMLKMAEYFERDLDTRVKTLTQSIEPILIVVLGISVAFLIISVITPIYSLISQIQ